MAERSADWIAQARRDLDSARWLVEGHFHEWACFAAKQAAEKAVKGVLESKGAVARGHSVTNLLLGLGEEVAVPDELVVSGRTLKASTSSAPWRTSAPSRAATRTSSSSSRMTASGSFPKQHLPHAIPLAERG